VQSTRLFGRLILLALVAALPRPTAAQSAESGTLQLPGAALPYVVEGQGTPCLVYGSSVYYPRTFSPRFNSTLRCVHLTERGFVPGATRRDGVPFGIDEAVHDIELARRQLGMERFVLVGHSIHGLVALAYAARYPQHVSHVVAIGAPPTIPLPADSANAYRARSLTPGRQAQHARNLRALDSLVAAHPRRQAIAMYVANAALYWADSTYDATPLWKGMVMNDTLTADLQGGSFTWDSARTPVSVPAFVAVGRHDYLVTPNLWSGARVPFRSVTVRVFERAGHTAQLEESSAFDEQLLAFLAGRG